MAKRFVRQPPRWAKVSHATPLGRGITAHFNFNGTFESSVRGRPGKPVVTSGPSFGAGPGGRYAVGNGNGKVVTDLYAPALGIAGASPRSVIVDFYMGDTSASKCVFSVGDTSAQQRSQWTLITNNQYRAVQLATYGTDLTYFPYSTGGTGARVFMGITYDGNVTVNFRSWAKLDSTGEVVLNSQTSTLPGPLNTGTTFPLNIMGGGTYNFASMVTALYHLSIYGGRCLTPGDIDRLYADRYQVFEPVPTFPYAAINAVAAKVRAALYMGGQGYVMQSPGGLPVKPLVLVNGRVQQRVASEGAPLVLDKGVVRTIAADEILQI